ncbi:MAG: DUF4962 domain-containing protein [Actinomycetota bacterium]
MIVQPAVAQTLPGIPKIEIPSLGPGLWDPLDPPSFAPLDLGPPPNADAPHPRLLFSAGDLPAIRARVSDPSSVPGRAFSSLLSYVATIEPGDPILDRPGRRFGRQDLADLGLAWLITEDESYLRKAKALLVSIAAAAPNYGAAEVFDATEYYNTRAHILNGLALAWDLLYNDLDETERALLLSALLVLGSEHFAHSLTAWWGSLSAGSNFTGNNGAAIGMAGLATWGDLPTASLWFARGRQLVLSYFQEGFDETGAGYEGVLYGNYGMRIPTYFSAAVERSGLPNPLHHPKIRRHTRWVAYEVLPGGGAVNPLNDARYYELNPTQMLWASSRGADPDLAGWIWHNVTDRIFKGGAVAEPVAAMLWHRAPDPAFTPEQILPLRQAFAGRGLFHARSGWGADDLMTSFESRHNDWGEAIHQNQDVNSFTLYAHGARLVIDSGYANYLEQLLLGQDFEGARSSETEAHNYIEVDHRSQDFFGKGRLHTATSSSWIDVAGGDARTAYMVLQPKRANRWFVHLRESGGSPGSVVLADAFRQGLGEHDHRFYLQTEPGNAISIEPTGSADEVRATFHSPNGAALAVSMLGAHALSPERDTFTADYPDIGTHPRFTAYSRGTSFQALTALVPTGAGRPIAHGSRVAATNGVAMTSGSDLLLQRTSRGVVHAGGLHSDGTLTVRRDEERFALISGKRLRSNERMLAQIKGAPATVITDRDTVVITGPQVSGFRVWAPGAISVQVNGSGVDWASCGGYVVSPPSC